MGEADDATLSVAQATTELCMFCFQVLLARLHDWPDPAFPGCETQAPRSKVPGVFVSWKTAGSKLRGCMGTLRPVWLDRGLAHFAIKSAFGDRRFRPVALEELPGLTCKVSILHSFEPCEDAYDWELGVHGVRITFATTRLLCPCSSTFYSATFLPEVAAENGMDHESTIRQLVRKAGYSGRLDGSLLDSVEATRFRSSAEELSYDEFSGKVWRR